MMQTGDAVPGPFDGYVVEAMRAAPVVAPLMVIAFGGVFIISRLFLNNWRHSEEQRARTMDERHAVYFRQLENSNNAMIQAIDRGSEAIKEAAQVQQQTNQVLGGVRELMRDLREDQRDRHRRDKD